MELAHLLMSLAMVAMVWAWGGPAARWLMVAVFGLLAVAFLARAATSGGAAAPTDHTTRTMFGYHALAMASMTWMVAAMPLLGSHHFTDSGGSGHGHGGSGDARVAISPVAEVQLWAVVATVVLAVALVACAVAWAVNAARARRPSS